MKGDCGVKEKKSNSMLLPGFGLTKWKGVCVEESLKEKKENIKKEKQTRVLWTWRKNLSFVKHVQRNQNHKLKI